MRINKIQMTRRNNMSKLNLIALMAAVAMTASTAFSSVTNKELKIGISQEFENLNPLIMQMSATTYMYRMVGRTLVTIDSTGKWVTQLAKTIPSIEKGTAKLIDEGGTKKIQATWEIIEKAQWGDGTPVTCKDFVAARTIATSPNVSVGEKETFAQVEKIDIDAANPKKCTFTYSKAKWDFYQLANFYPVPSHLEDAVFAKHGKDKEGYEKNSVYTKNPTNPGLYNGPYLISDVKLGSHVTFSPNPKFYGASPKIQKVIVKLIPNTGTLEANLRSGTIDSISSIGFLLDQALALDKKVKSEKLPYTVEFKPGLVYEHIDLNLDNPILKDLKVRKALVTAIDRESLTTALFEGKQTPAIHFLAPMDPWYTADAKKVSLYKYSKRDAGKLLDEAGWTLDKKDGYRYKNGQKLSFVFMTTAGNKTRETVQAYLQNQWKEVGVEVTIKNEPARVFFGETTSKRKFSGMAMYAWTSSPENNPRSNLATKSIPTEKNGWSGQNFPGWSNAQVDKLVEDMDTEFSPAKRKEIAQKILKLYTDDVPVIPLYYRSDVAVVPTALKGFKLPGHQFAETNEIENWDIK
jgi:peptide/nickel transport system substrate-binding protein